MSANSEDAAFVKRWLDELAQSQWHGPLTQKKRQRRKLAELLRHARRHVPFYRDRLEALFDTGGSIDWDRWRDIPLLTREDVRTKFDVLTSRAIAESEETSIERHTSGSSGSTIKVMTTARNHLKAIALSHRALTWHGFDPARTMAWIMPRHLESGVYPDFERFSTWSRVTGLLGTAGELLVLSIHSPIPHQIRWLEQQRPAYLHTFPNNAMALAQELQRQGRRLSGLKAVWLVGERLPEGLRELCRDWLGARVVDTYGCVEAGYIAVQCPDHEDRYHVQNDTVMLEVVDGHNRPCGPGESGSVVVTNLINMAFPLIRYRLYDHVTLGEQCPCGRGLPVITAVHGRERNLFRFPDGTVIWPHLGIKHFSAGLNPIRWQVAQTGPLEIEFRYIPGQGAVSNPDLTEITSYIRAILRQSVTVRLKPVAELPLPVGGKFHDYVCELDDNECCVSAGASSDF